MDLGDTRQGRDVLDAGLRVLTARRGLDIALGHPELFVDHDTPSPERRCTCGVSAFYEPFEHTGVSSVVAVGGRAILHDIWLRAEKARVDCFALGARVARAASRVPRAAGAEIGRAD